MQIGTWQSSENCGSKLYLEGIKERNFIECMETRGNKIFCFPKHIKATEKGKVTWEDTFLHYFLFLLPICKTGIGAVTIIQEPQHTDEICFWVPKRLLLPIQRSNLHNYETISIHCSKSPNL